MTKRRSLFVLALVIAMGVLPLVAQQQQADRVKAIGGNSLHVRVLPGPDAVQPRGLHHVRRHAEGIGPVGESRRFRSHITQAFVQQFGTTVYAEPPKTGFSLIAWAMPVIYFVAGAALVLFVISRWRKRPQAAAWTRLLPLPCGRQNFPGSHGSGRAQAPGRQRTKVILAGMFLALAVNLQDLAAGGACLGLAAAVFLFVFYIHPDASDLAPHRTKLDQLLERRDAIYDNCAT